MPKKSRQKFKYIENEKSFQDKIKSIFYQFRRAIIEAKKIFFGRWESDFKNVKSFSSLEHGPKSDKNASAFSKLCFHLC